MSVWLLNINNIKFYANFHTKDREGRVILQLKSIEKISKTNEIERTFYVYNSISEGCLYRLLYIVLVKGSFLYYKGSDYITETFIDIQLQKAIDMYFDKIPENTTISVANIYDHLKTNLELKEILRNRKENYHQCSALEPLKLCPSGKCFTNKYLDYIFGIKKTEEIEKELEPIRSKLNQEYLKEFLDIMSSKQRQIIEVSSDIGYDNKEALADFKTETYIELLNKYLDKYIDYNSISDFNYIYSNSCNVFSNLTMMNNYYRIIVNINGEPYEVIFNNLELKSDNSSDYILIITNIIPIDNKTTPYGLYSNILSVGILIYKILEYSNQTNTRDARYQSGHYYYLGNYLSNLNLLKRIKELYFTE